MVGSGGETRAAVAARPAVPRLLAAAGIAAVAHLEHRCKVIFSSHLDDDPSHYAMQEWLGGGYTEDGSTIYALVHEEYHGEGNSQCGAPEIAVGDRLSCWMPAITEAISTD